MSTGWRPFREPPGATLLRTGAIAVVGGAVLAHFRGGMGRWPVATLVVLWPSLGGHFVELWFLNWLRPRLPEGRVAQNGARLVVWFIGGMGLAAGMSLTAMALAGFHPRWAAVWWVGGIGFIGFELVAHLGLLLLRKPNFFDGRG